MNDIQENKLSSYEATNIVLNKDNYKALWNPIANIVEVVTQFQTLVGEIQTLAIAQEQIITGYATSKEDTRTRLTEATLKVINGVVTYAIFENDTELKESMNYTYSDLRNSRDNILAEIAANVYTVADPLKVQLADYLVSEAEIALVDTLKNQFLEQLAEPRAALANKKETTAELEQKFNAVDDLLKNKMDRVILIFKPGNPEFVMNYFNARKIIDLGVRHEKEKAGKITGVVKAAGNLIPINKAVINIAGTKRQTKTDENGNYKFIFRVKGYPKLEAEAEGYQKAAKDAVEMGPGKELTVNFELEPV